MSHQTSEHSQAGTETTTTSSVLQTQIWENLWATGKEVGEEKEKKNKQKKFTFFCKKRCNKIKQIISETEALTIKI